MSYSGKATTVGHSRAITFESALFKAHPEFAAGRMQAHVIGPGTLLVTTAEPMPGRDGDEDPAVLAYLSFLDRDMRAGPQQLRPIGKAAAARLRKLTRGIAVDLDAALDDDGDAA